MKFRNHHSDTSRMLHDRYYGMTNRNIELVLKDGRHIRGIIVGFCEEDEDAENSPIHLWHIVDPDQRGDGTSIDYELIKGIFVRHKDIISVTFEDDHSTMYC